MPLVEPTTTTCKVEDIFLWIDEGRDIVAAPDAMEWLRENIPQTVPFVRVSQLVSPGRVCGIDREAYRKTVINAPYTITLVTGIGATTIPPFVS